MDEGEKMKRLIVVFFALALMGGVVFAKDDSSKGTTSSGTQVEFVTTGQGDKPAGGGHDAPDVGDPYAGKTVTERDNAGSALTQQSYENCTTDACRRAEKRWNSEGTNYKDDVNQGLRKPYGTEGAESQPH
jgi:hypothetical protein